ncbi:hypothetical protein Micbo1qcDRAFT_201347 [Microdochium bolleyi]|uniref:Uncharacterized protein n=1 Tax=Microdochium bolleyi TaxID=196109 RepID=A0A136JFS0_9PEZI|nr:hypothetical protein Micbo1qcDRAFT_201347 [Microdochium bolleyi]
MCITEFIAYTCGHRSVPVHRPCPMTTSLHTNPVCPPPTPLLSPPNHAQYTCEPAAKSPQDGGGDFGGVIGGGEEVGYAERATYAEGMCGPCLRVLHTNWVNIVEYEHRWMHERGACECPVVFPALMGPRVVGGAEQSRDGNRDDERRWYHEGHQGGIRQNSTEVCGDSHVKMRGYSKSENYGRPNGRSPGKKIRVSKARRRNHPSPPSMSSIAPPLFEERAQNSHPYSWPTPSAWDTDDGGHYGQARREKEDGPHLRVSIRLPSLYAAEWTHDHRLRHENGQCHCPVSFERYHVQDDDNRNPIHTTDEDQESEDEDWYVSHEREHHERIKNDDQSWETRSLVETRTQTDSVVEYLAAENEEHTEFFVPFKLDRKGKGRTKTGRRLSLGYRAGSPWQTANSKTLETSQDDHSSSAEETTSSTSPAPQSRAAAIPHRSSTRDQGQTNDWSVPYYCEDGLSTTGSRELTFMERVMGPVGPDAPAWELPLRTKSKSGLVASSRTHTNNRGTAPFAAVVTPGPRLNRCDDEVSTAYSPEHTPHASYKKPRRCRHRCSRSHSTPRLYQRSRHRRQGQRQQQYFSEHEREHQYPAGAAVDDDNDNYNKTEPRKRPKRLPIAGFPIGAGPEGHCHAGDFSMCLLSRRGDNGSWQGRY